MDVGPPIEEVGGAGADGVGEPGQGCAGTHETGAAELFGGALGPLWPRRRQLAEAAVQEIGGEVDGLVHDGDEGIGHRLRR
ncbi:hypothetical protein GCM10009609_49150 [Pseudonocardia aurantiaca]|uniref:Uncharacterized protein n=1 Tax=Pseudonocardia aurantiaca TaxID=75290 RepID=A0ABW4FWH4_9PSEU